MRPLLAARPRRLRSVVTFVALAVAVSGLAAATLAGTPRAVALTTTTSNLLTGDQASFDGGTTGGWSGGGATVSVVSSPTQAGPGALAITTTTAGNVTVQSGSDSFSLTAAQPGAHYTGSMWFQAANPGRTIAPILLFYSQTGNTLGSAWGQGSVDQAASWTQTVPVVGIAPANTAYVALAAMFFGTAAGEVHYLDTATLTQTSGSVSPVAAPLHTQGNAILDANGRAIALRGIHRDGLEASATLTITQDEIDHARQWGANFLRIPLGEQFWLSNNCQYDPTYASKVDSVVNWITSRGMVALLDLHTNSLSPCGPSGLQMMADSPGSVTFWKQVAARYRWNNLVAFDLYNEPHDISDAVWRSGGWVTSDNTTFKAAGMQQLYNAVRSTGANNLVFVSGNSWANDWPSTAPLSGYNIVYGVHAYTCPTAPPPNCALPDPYDPSPILNGWVTPSATHPVVVTEFGFPDMYSGTYNQNVINFAEAHHWGWDQFAWFGWSGGTWGMLADTGPNYEPMPNGMPALAGFASNP